MIGFFLILILAIISSLLICRYSDQAAQQIKTEAILSALPQTQCGQCNYTGCKPYAKAVVQGEADFNQCPPGGTATIKILANILGRQVKPLDPKHGQSNDMEKEAQVALIDETLCIGCVKCINVCPTDAILGAAKQMHTVIPTECTGCELCIAPCPMDCISMQAMAG